MKKSIMAAMLFATAICAQATDKKPDQTQAPAAAPANPKGIPREAVRTADGTYRYTDPQGKQWVYVVTAFGPIKNALPDADSQPAAAPVNSATKVTDKGDVVRFEQPGPFGAIVWEKKKSELSDPERQLVDAQNRKQNQNQNQTTKPDTK